MAVDIEGWVEMSEWPPDERNDEYAWSGIIALGPFIIDTDSVSEAFFGFTKRCLIGEDIGYIPIAKDRGLPPNPSGAVLEDLRVIREHEKKFGTGEFLAFTHASYEELLTADLKNLVSGEIGSSDWNVIFHLIESLRSERRFRNAGFRLVCWVCW